MADADDGADNGADAGDATLRSEALQIFALCGFAIAQPLFDLVGRNPTFLVVHDVGGVGLVAFALALVLVPPALLVGVLSLVRLASARAAWRLFCVFAGALVALFVVPALDRAVGISDGIWLGALLLVGVGAGMLFARARSLRRFATYLALAPVLFVVLFLVTSPAHALLADNDPAAIAGPSTATTPVVELVFDEFPLGAIVDAQGHLDEARFPGFARLARLSTWYPNTTTVSTQTHLAVPAILSGRIPDPDAAPVAAVYPRTLFTMLGRSGPVRATEDVTHLCPDSICGSRPTVSSTSLLKDTAIVLGHSILPDGMESEWLPSLDGRWSDFGDESAAVEPSGAPPPSAKKYLDALSRTRAAAGGRTDPVVLFKQFVASIKGPARPALWYGHFHLPHRTYKRLPNGALYIDPSVWSQIRDKWPLTTSLSGFQATRLMLQTAYADHLLGELLDRLDHEKLLDRAMVVVVADHGQSLQEPTNTRGLAGITKVNRDEVLPVPLFVKYPGESQGRIDRRHAETIDILPTIADELDAQLPSDWKFDGSSLLKPPVSRRPTSSLLTGPPELFTDVRAARMGRWMRRQIVAEHDDQSDLYRLAPYGALVGRPAAELNPIAARDATATIDSASAYDDVQPTSGRLPALVRARLSGIDGNDGDHIAVALNGTIAGVGPMYRDGGLRAAAVVDPVYFRAGANTVTLYRVTGDAPAPTLQAITTRP